MIVSVSRRTDIPALYSDWFFQRLKAGYALVRNPMNPHQVSRVALDEKSADAFVFWSKNPQPMLARLGEIGERPYYFQFTLTPYGADVEGALPDKRVLMDTFARLSDRLGPERVIWRYDPILITPRYNADFHQRAFEKMAKRLHRYTRRVTVSFIDPYRHIQRAADELGVVSLDETAQYALVKPIVQCAQALGLNVDTCCEAANFDNLGVLHAHCIDTQLLSRIAGLPAAVQRDPNQRLHCGCAASVDIGAYDTCSNGCRYCYAVHGAKAVGCYDAKSPLLCSALAETDVVRERAMPPTFFRQMSFL